MRKSGVRKANWRGAAQQAGFEGHMLGDRRKAPCTLGPFSLPRLSLIAAKPTHPWTQANMLWLVAEEKNSLPQRRAANLLKRRPYTDNYTSLLLLGRGAGTSAHHRPQIQSRDWMLQGRG